MWSDYEDRVVAELAREAGTEATADMRLEAIRLVGIARTLTAPEMLSAAGHLGGRDSAGSWPTGSARSRSDPGGRAIPILG